MEHFVQKLLLNILTEEKQNLNKSTGPPEGCFKIGGRQRKNIKTDERYLKIRRCNFFMLARFGARELKIGVRVA